jgi:hypothetical protein
MTIHIVLWLWKGWRPVYDRRDVAYIARQLLAYGDLPHTTRILCLTDRPTDWEKAKLASLGVLEMPLWPELSGLNMGASPSYPWLPAIRGIPNCYRRLRIFDPDTQASMGIKPGDIILSMDLDSIIWGSIPRLLAPMFNQVGGVDFMAMEGRVSRIHGSLFALRAGTHRRVWDDFDPAVSPGRLRNPPRGVTRFIGSDQAWMSTVMPEVPLWGPKDNVWSWPRHHTTIRPSDPITYMSFAGNTKPRGSMCAMSTPWIHAHAMKHWEE